jgi:hypothetical protein
MLLSKKHLFLGFFARDRFASQTFQLEYPICLPVGLPVSVSYQPSSVGIFGMVFGIKGGLQRCKNAANSLRRPCVQIAS